MMDYFKSVAGRCIKFFQRTELYYNFNFLLKGCVYLVSNVIVVVEVSDDNMPRQVSYCYSVSFKILDKTAKNI